MKYAALVIFMLVMVAVGIYSRRKTKTVNEFFLGGRDVGPWLSAFAYGTTYFSAVLFVGYAGKIGFGFGLSSLWIMVGNTVVGSLLAWRLLAKRTRAQTVRLDAMTMPAYLSARYGSRWMKIVAAIIIFVFLVPYSASVYTGLAYLFNTVFNINFTAALWIMAALTGVYLVLGGYLAVARNDLIQGIVMIVGVVLMIGYVTHAKEVGGLFSAAHNLHAKFPANATWWPAWDLSSFGWGAILKSPGVTLLSLVVLTSLGTWGLPQMVHKFYAIRDDKVVKPAIIISSLFALLMTFGAYFTGALTHLFPAAGALAKAKNFDAIMPTVLNQALPELLVAVILLLVLSASMSTLAGLVMVSSSAISVDLVQGELKRDIGKTAQVTLMRALIVVFVVISVIIAQQKLEFIVNLMALSWGAVAGAFLGPFVWGLFSKRITKAGAWAGMLIPLAFMIIWGWHYAANKLTAGYVPIIAAIAMFASLIITPLVSMVSPRLADETVAKAFTDGVAPASLIAADSEPTLAAGEGESA